MLDGVNVSSWARTQKAIATSSGESELYAMSAGAAEALGLRELLTDVVTVQQPWELHHVKVLDA